MERETWKLLVRAVRSADRRAPRLGRRKVYSDQQIVKMHLWAVMHDRPMYRACDPRHYYGWYRPSQLPSVSQFSRRRFAVRSMNEGEPAIARDLVPHVNDGSLVPADANYDSALLYQTIHCQGGQLLTRLKGMSENREQLMGMGAGRRTAIRWWKEMPRVCQALMVFRASVERTFSALTCFGGGLTTLPPWVRGLRRVTNWVTAKIAIYNARLRCQMSQAQAA